MSKNPPEMKARNLFNPQEGFQTEIAPSSEKDDETINSRSRAMINANNAMK
jgi:hypothetical protein